LDFIYAKEDISYPIATAISEYKKGAIHHNEIHRRVERILGHPISDNKLLKALSDMVQKKDLSRNDPKEGKRGFKVFYSLTHEGKEKYRLRILGPREKVRKKKALYQLIIYFEVYKRRPLLTKIQLSRFLRQIGSSMKELENERDVGGLGNISGILFKPIKGVDIMGITKYDKGTKTDRMFYYTVLPGFSVGEFVSYLKLLKNKTEPRPISVSNSLIPYARYTHFSKKEINESISSFRKDGLIKTIDPIIRGERRFAMTDDRFRNLSYYIWAIQMIDINLLIGRLILKKPTDKEREYLSLYLGDKSADSVLAHAYEIRRQYKKEKNNDDDKDREAIESLEQEREFLVKELTERCKSTIEENKVVHEIMEGVCYSPLLSREE
jgi:hypothetical protein